MECGGLLLLQDLGYRDGIMVRAQSWTTTTTTRD